MLVEPICERPRSKKKDEFDTKKRAEKAERLRKEVEDSGADFEVVEDESDEQDEKPEYPPRPHGSFKE